MTYILFSFKYLLSGQTFFKYSNVGQHNAIFVKLILAVLIIKIPSSKFIVGVA